MKVKQKKGDICTFEEYTKPASSKPDKETWGKLKSNFGEYRELYPEISWQTEKSHTVTMLKEAPLTVYLDSKNQSVGFEFWCESEGKTSRFLTTNLSLLAQLAEHSWGMTKLLGKTLEVVRTGDTYRVTDKTVYRKPSGPNSSQNKQFWQPEGI